jgi:hypothetical protein
MGLAAGERARLSAAATELTLPALQVTQRDGTYFLAFKYDASEIMSLSVYWGLDTVALSSSVEQWNLKHAEAGTLLTSAAGWAQGGGNKVRDRESVPLCRL